MAKLVHVEVSVKGEELHVSPVWADVDRPKTETWVLSNTPRDKKLADRIVAAIESGVATRDATVKTDINGKTYISVNVPIFGKTMNADLKRLGF